MRIVFRTDASLDIGTGHVMRCLTLAHELCRQQGATCSFICREHDGNLLEFISQCGFEAYGLPVRQNNDFHECISDGCPSHAAWLGANWIHDAEETLARLIDAPVDWLIVDHYALDARWEQTLRAACQHLMVIDDMADRLHDCDLLLDQNLGRQLSDYIHLVPEDGKILTGPPYALLRPEFYAFRHSSLDRRVAPQLQQILITMGGVDRDNATAQVLDGLKRCQLPEDCRIVVVMGSQAPWLEQIQTMAAEMPWETKVLVNVKDMARLMAESDLAIGAAGSTSWERCCLGLPTLMVVLAENQRSAAQFLEQAGAAHILDLDSDIYMQLSFYLSKFIQTPSLLMEISRQAEAICDGKGTIRVLEALLACQSLH